MSNNTILVIDGYNVIYAIPDLREKILKQGPLAAREAFIEICAKYKHSRQEISCIYIIFDGIKQIDGVVRKTVRSVEIIFSRDKEADEVIIELLKKNEPARNFIVISSDNYVRNNSKVYGASLMSPTAFFNELGKRIIPKDKPAKKKAVDIKFYNSEITDWYTDELKKRGSL